MQGTLSLAHNGFLGHWNFTIMSDLPASLLQILRNSEPFPNISHTGCEPSFALAKYWMTTCKEGHQLCNSLKRSNVETQLPTRVVVVGGEEDPTVRLWVTEGRKGRYTALSHCWGKSSIIQTVKSNYLQHQSSISIAAMSRTFQDAIVVTRRLNIPYLWIDSLCIIQDSAEDWRRESTTMDGIYQNTEVTIAALAASDGSGGCFRPTAAHSIRPCRFPQLDSFVATAYSQPSTTAYINLRNDNHWDIHNAIIAPLNTRGWTLQETMLSTRILMYTDTELRWACLETRACECLPYMRPRGDESMEPEMSAVSQKFDQHTLYRDWYKRLKTYTERNLTMEQDIFPAISGIAKRMQKLLDDEYVAGLWKRDIRTGLSWNCELVWGTDEDIFPKRPTEYRSPSWSWASVIHPIENFFSEQSETKCYEHILADIRNIRVENVANDPFGQVLFGELQVYGHFLPADIGINVARGYSELHIVSDVANDQQVGVAHHDEIIYPRQKVLCVPITSYDAMPNNFMGPMGKPQSTLCCICVIHASERSDIYRRVAVGYITKSLDNVVREFESYPKKAIVII